MDKSLNMEERERKLIDIDSLNDDIINSIKKNSSDFINSDKQKAYKYKGVGLNKA